MLSTNKLFQKSAQAHAIQVHVDMVHEKTAKHILNMVSRISEVRSTNVDLAAGITPQPDLVITDRLETAMGKAAHSFGLIFLTYDEVLPGTSQPLVKVLKKPAKMVSILSSLNSILSKIYPPQTELRAVDSKADLLRPAKQQIENLFNLFPLRILVVEDDEMNQKVLIWAISFETFTLLAARESTEQFWLPKGSNC